jgi:hypothetical protein|tara:strand:- start:173 stop:595 length:423 start_codon:yes stop_codon:yes gene_type:complete
MASIQNDIRAALESKLSSTSGLPPIAYENVAFVPTTGTSFLKVQYLPTVTRPAARGLNPQLRYQGVFSVTAYTPEGRGPATADDFANKVIDAFAATTDISFTNADAETITVSIDYAERQQGMVDSPWYFTPINIGWYIYN